MLMPDTTIDELLSDARRHPEQLGLHAFWAARLVRRDGLGYYRTFNQLVGIGLTAGIAEADARRAAFKGFAYAAAGHDTPPASLVMMRVRAGFDLIQGGAA
jgi:hypothetical protein